MDCSERTISKFESLLDDNSRKGGEEIELDLEAEFSSLALDIIGLGVFNYDFGSVSSESPVIQVLIPCTVFLMAISNVYLQHQIVFFLLHFILTYVSLDF